MAWVYILRSSTGRHYNGSCVDLAPASRNISAVTPTTKRLGTKLAIVAKKEVPTLEEARRIERALKRKKNPVLAIYYLQQ